MCGILGSVNMAYCAKALDSIQHRGPDAEGVVHLQDNGHTLSLAHKRLSIVDLSANGAQPMISADAVSHLVFNGEIYNHQELRSEIAFKAFKGHSDTETLLYAMNEKGEECLDSMNGIFAFALYDSKQKKLYLARDRFGVKPLYYRFENNAIFFCSEIRAFATHFDFTLNLQNVAEGLQMRFVASPQTVYTHIRKVEPGQVIIFDLETVQLQPVKKVL